MIDAHVHLWLEQRGKVDGLPVYSLGGGRSMFGNEIVQMTPPYMTDAESDVYPSIEGQLGT